MATASLAWKELQTGFETAKSLDGFVEFDLIHKTLARRQDISNAKQATIVELRRLSRLHPNNAPLASLLGSSLLEGESYVDACRVYEAVVAKAPNPIALRRLVDLYVRLGREAALLDLLGDIVAQTHSLEFLGADRLQRLARNKRLNQTLQKLVDAKPPSIRVGGQFVLAILAVHRQDGRAGQLFREVLKSAPGHTDLIWQAWGLELTNAGNVKQAIAVFRLAVADNKVEHRFLFQYYLAGALVADGQPVAAINVARAAARSKPTDPLIKSRLAWVYMQAGHFSQADRGIQGIDCRL